jgi:alpha-galactosidase
MSFYTSFEHRQADGTYVDLYPALRAGLPEGRIPKPSSWNERCPNLVRYEMLMRLGYFVTESSSTSPSTRPGSSSATARPDRALRHPARRVPQALRGADRALGDAGAGVPRRRDIEVKPSHEYASSIVNSVVTASRR